MMTQEPKQRIAIRDVVEFMALPLLTAATFILWDMNQNINKLNIQVGVIIAERTVTSETLKDHELRIRLLETQQPTKGKK